MEKKRLLHRLSVSLISILVSFAAYSDVPTEKQIEAFKARYRDLVPDKKAMERVKGQFKGLTEARPKAVPEERVEKSKEGPGIDTDAISGIEEEITKRKGRKEEYIFYLFSASVPEKVLTNVFMQSKKLGRVNFQGVVRGLSERLMKKLRGMQSYDAITVRPNPFIFRHVEAAVVPAFVYAVCPSGNDFDSDLCDYRCIVYGDTSLLGALYEMKDVCRDTAKYYAELKAAF